MKAQLKDAPPPSALPQSCKPRHAHLFLDTAKRPDLFFLFLLPYFRRRQPPPPRDRAQLPRSDQTHTTGVDMPKNKGKVRTLERGKGAAASCPLAPPPPWPRSCVLSS